MFYDFSDGIQGWRTPKGHQPNEPHRPVLHSPAVGNPAPSIYVNAEDGGINIEGFRSDYHWEHYIPPGRYSLECDIFFGGSTLLPDFAIAMLGIMNDGGVAGIDDIPDAQPEDIWHEVPRNQWVHIDFQDRLVPYVFEWPGGSMPPDPGDNTDYPGFGPFILCIPVYDTAQPIYVDNVRIYDVDTGETLVIDPPS
jgi:hypothetical protein